MYSSISVGMPAPALALQLPSAADTVSGKAMVIGINMDTSVVESDLGNMGGMAISWAVIVQCLEVAPLAACLTVSQMPRQVCND
ncbi:MAG: hypothetical protein ABIR94_09015 [Rubrivivax sp.]